MMKNTLLLSGFCWLAAATVWGIEYNVVLDAGQEIPAPSLGGATPSGTAAVSVNTITGDVSVSGTFTGLTSNATASHIHGLAAPGSAAGVILPLTIDSATSGSLSGGGTLSSSNLAGLLAGSTYINIHTPNNGPGEIRGQIVDSDIRVFSLMLDPGQSVPAPTLGGATPSGQATLVVDSSSGQVEVSGTYNGMTSNVAAGHLHGLAGPGSTAGVLIPFTVSGGTDGSFSGMGTLDASGLAGLLDGQTYINIHTANNGSGEIRAQVPEPQSLVLLVLGSVALLGRRRAR